MFRRRLLHFLALQVVFVVLGLGTAVALAALLALKVDPLLGEPLAAEQVQGRDRWEVQVRARRGAAYVRSFREVRAVNIAAYSVEQAIGPPDTPGYGDAITAWCSLAADATPLEWLELDYARAVLPKEVHVCETYSPGALVRVTVFDPAGNEVQVWAGKDPSAQMPILSISKVPIAADYPVSRIRVYFDMAAVPGWSEIDAVGLMGQNDVVQWAKAARGSTAYGTSPPPIYSVTLPSPRDLLPEWGPFADAGAAITEGQVAQEERLATAFGWPFLAVYGTRDVPPPALVLPTPGTPANPANLDPVILQELGYGDYTSGKRMIGRSGWSQGSPSWGGSRGGSAKAVSVDSALMLRGVSPPVPPAPPPAPAAAPAMPQMRGIIWPGMLANAAIFALAIQIAFWLGRWWWSFRVQFHRMRRGACIECGYDLGYDFINGCPECGWRRQGLPLASPSHRPAVDR